MQLFKYPGGRFCHILLYTGGSRFDQVMMLAYDIEHGIALYITTGQLRSSGSDTLPMPAIQGVTLHIYMAFNGFDRTTQSDSVYMGTISY